MNQTLKSSILLIGLLSVSFFAFNFLSNSLNQQSEAPQVETPVTVTTVQKQIEIEKFNSLDLSLNEFINNELLAISDDCKKFGSWLYKIANNLCLDELKRVGRKRATSLEALKSAPQTEIERAADSALMRNEAIVLLHKALLQLPIEQRVVVIMKEYEGLTFREIAEILNESENTIKSRLYYGLRALRKMFDSWKINKEVFSYD